MKLFLLTVLAAGSVQAAKYQCDYAGSQREMNQCAISDYITADALMKKSYLLALQKPHPELLVDEQKAWEKARDAKCVEAKKGAGENVTISYLTCMKTATELRTLQILQH
jgi:uncharacterized protein YecT (DUF1311 family)